MNYPVGAPTLVFARAVFVRASAYESAPERFFVAAFLAEDALIGEAPLLRFAVSRFDVVELPAVFALLPFAFFPFASALEDSEIFSPLLARGEPDASRLAFAERIAAALARAARDERDRFALSSRVWPGKIIGFRSPLIRMSRSGVVSYLRAIARIVSPRRTVCTLSRAVLFG